MSSIPSSTQPTTEHPAPLNPQGYSRIQPTADLVGIHHQTLRRWWKSDKFPKPLDINGIPMFRNTELLAWLASHHSASEVN